MWYSSTEYLDTITCSLDKLIITLIISRCFSAATCVQVARWSQKWRLRLSLSNTDLSSPLLRPSVSDPTKTPMIMIKRSNYDSLHDNCILNKLKFTDKEFSPNDKSLNFEIPGGRLSGREPQLWSLAVVWSKMNFIPATFSREILEIATSSHQSQLWQKWKRG